MSLNHYENFPVDSVPAPPELSPPVAAICRLARTANELADEGNTAPVQCLDSLSSHRAELHAAAAGSSTPAMQWQYIVTPLKLVVDHVQVAQLRQFDELHEARP
jgi:hypothetical protein